MVFDPTIVAQLKLNSHELELLDHRGDQYYEIFKLLQSGDNKEFTDRLHYKFPQFCKGGGEADSPVMGEGYGANMKKVLLADYIIERTLSVVSEAMKKNILA